MSQNIARDDFSIRLFRFLRKYSFAVIVLLILFPIMVFIGYTQYNRLLSNTSNQDYIQIDIGTIQTYDPYYPHKYFIPTPDKRGIKINLHAETHYEYMEVVASPGSYFHIDFYNNQQLVGEIDLSTLESEKLVIPLPEQVTKNGYTGVLFTPIMGSNYYLSHLDFIKTYEENVVLKEYPLKTKTMISGTDKIGDPHNITGIIVYLLDYGDQKLTLEVGNIGGLTVELLSISILDSTKQLEFDRNTQLSPFDTEISFNTYSFNNVDSDISNNPFNLYVQYKYTDNPEIHTAAVFPFHRHHYALFHSTLIREVDNSSDFPFITKQDNAIYFNGTDIQIDEPLILPANMTVILQEGQKIDLVNKAFILTRSPILAIGSLDNPITIYSSDGTGAGLAVLQAKEKSQLLYVNFDNLSNPTSGVWGLTGAVTFYESDVDIRNCKFLNNRSEDGINIVRSDFTMRESYFLNTFADAFDSDFSDGKIEDSLFEMTGNDGLDISTSNVSVINTQFKNIGDKGISTGENSLISLSHIDINGAVIGIASKDKSLVTGDAIIISNIQIGLALYQKKPEFGPAEINITDTEIKGLIGLDYLIQPGSTLTLNGVKVHPRSKEKEKVIIDKLIAGEKISW